MSREAALDDDAGGGDGLGWDDGRSNGRDDRHSHEARTRAAAQEAAEARWASLFAALWLWVGLSSSWDMYLAVRLAACLDEENPLGRVLIGWGGVPLLAGAKMAGTVLVLGVLSHLWHAWRRAAWAAAFALAAVQAAVVLYLHLA